MTQTTSERLTLKEVIAMGVGGLDLRHLPDRGGRGTAVQPATYIFSVGDINKTITQ